MSHALVAPERNSNTAMADFSDRRNLDGLQSASGGTSSSVLQFVDRSSDADHFAARWSRNAWAYPYWHAPREINSSPVELSGKMIAALEFGMNRQS